MPLNYSKWDQLEVSPDLFVHCMKPLFETLHSSLTIQISKVIPTSTKSLSFGGYTSSYLTDVFFKYLHAAGSNGIFTKNVKFARKRSGISKLRSIATKFSYHESKRSTLISSISLHLFQPLLISTLSLNDSRPILRRTVLQELIRLNWNIPTMAWSSVF